jgi:ribonuclease BN (tRNA processing enzyme)
VGRRSAALAPDISGARVQGCAEKGGSRRVVRVTVLGSGDAFGSGGRLHSAYLVESETATFVLDCGPTILQSLKRTGRDPAALDFVVLSHLHGDHFGGVPFLFMEYLYESPRTRPFAVYGPAGVEPRVRALFSALYEKSASEPFAYSLRWTELRADTPETVRGVRILPFVVPHVSELVAFAYRVEVEGRVIVYSGDSAWTEKFVEQTRGADLFLCECSTYETRLDIHLSYPEIAARAADLGCRRLVLSHLGAEPLRRLPELSLECAVDGMTIDL